MHTFLLLPPRELLEHALADFFAKTLPGVPLPRNLLDTVMAQFDGPHTFVVHREDLSGPAADALRDEFGAEPGDRVLEVGPPRAGCAAAVREWVVAPAVSAATSAR